MYIHMYMHTCIYIYTYICIYMYTYIHTYIRIYIHTYIHKGELQGIKSYSETVTRGTRVSVESFYVPMCLEYYKKN